eukprot:Rhum_TRINITY_DN11055_c0_g1::Rhum_TRINITY_DN11055_c0_g1_i1::g.42112::m.42112
MQNAPQLRRSTSLVLVEVGAAAPVHHVVGTPVLAAHAAPRVDVQGVRLLLLVAQLDEVVHGLHALQRVRVVVLLLDVLQQLRLQAHAVVADHRQLRLLRLLGFLRRRFRSGGGGSGRCCRGSRGLGLRRLRLHLRALCLVLLHLLRVGWVRLCVRSTLPLVLRVLLHVLLLLRGQWSSGDASGRCRPCTRLLVRLPHRNCVPLQRRSPIASCRRTSVHRRVVVPHGCAHDEVKSACTFPQGGCRCRPPRATDAALPSQPLASRHLQGVGPCGTWKAPQATRNKKKVHRRRDKQPAGGQATTKKQ